jgi:heptaprenyl diphosphate synthase
MRHYLRVIEDKTASLIEASARFGAMVAQSSPDVLETLARFGHEIGMAFQLSDDLIDVTSDVAGKIPGTDLREGVPTLPVLMLGDSPQDQDLRQRIADGLHSDADVASVVGTLRESPVIERSRSVIAEHADRARTYLDSLPEGAPRQALVRLCEDVVNRSR